MSPHAWRCPMTLDGRRCGLPEGHAGMHSANGVEFHEGRPATPHPMSDPERARRMAEREEGRTVGAVYEFGPDAEVAEGLLNTQNAADRLREAIRELLAVDGGDGAYDAVRLRAARDKCRELVKGDAAS